MEIFMNEYLDGLAAYGISSLMDLLHGSTNFGLAT